MIVASPNFESIFQVDREILADDVEAMAQLDWLWSSNRLNRKIALEDETSVAEVSKQLDKDFQRNETNGGKSKPVERWANRFSCQVIV